MIVICPACHSKYSVQSEAIGESKLVRCAVCNTTWHQYATDTSDYEKKRVTKLIQWTFFWFVVFISFFSLFFAKNAIIKIWQPAIVFYHALGLDSDNQKKPLVIQNISNFFVQKKGKLYMGLRGELVNTSDEVKIVPSLIITLKDDTSTNTTNRPAYKKIWTHDMMYKKLLSNQKIVFETELQSVPYNNLICDIRLDTL